MPAKLSAVGLLVLGLVAGTLALPALSPPAAAVGVFAGVSWTTPVTWVDGAGRQYVTVTTGAANGDGWPTLRIARDLADGTPDASWGTVGGTDGLAEVAFEPPTSGVAMNPNVAAADDGTLSVAWRESTCSGDACWRWFSRHDGATGARIGTAVDRSSGVALARQLDDGTWLGHDGGTLVRIDGAGAALGVPALASDDVAAADPTASGDLLTIDLTATLRRTPAGGGADDLTLATGCATAYAGTSLGGFAVGAAPGGGFAVACRPAVGGPLTVTSYDAAGVEQWTTPTTSPDIELAYPDRVTVDADGRVWVAGRSSGSGVVPSPGVATLGSYTEAGDELVDYARSTGTSLENGMDVSGTGIRDLRTVGPDHIAFADLKLCCRYPNNTSISNSVYGQTFPKAPTPPTCEGPRPRLAMPSTTSLEVTFDACDHQPVERQPTGYRVELSGEAGASTTTVAHVEGMGPQTVTITDVAPAERAVIQVVPFNDEGDTTGFHNSGWAVLPFPSIEAFAGRQLVEVWGWPLRFTAYQMVLVGLQTGATTPAELMASSVASSIHEPTIAPLARIYRAYFLRNPDPGGLDFWIRRREAGWTIQRISEHFSRSSEFLRTYGALSDREFVELIYRNVLGREADPGGADYWTRRLQRGTPRGTVMAQFSESSEFVRTSAPYVAPLVVSKLMLDRPPTAAERDRWALEADPYATIPSEILGTEEYRLRIAADQPD